MISEIGVDLPGIALKPQTFSFLCPGAEEELSSLYKHVVLSMFGIYQDNQEVDSLIQIARWRSCINHSTRL